MARSHIPRSTKGTASTIRPAGTMSGIQEEGSQSGIFSGIYSGISAIIPDRQSHDGEKYSPGHGAGHEGRPSKLLYHVGVALVLLLFVYAFLLFAGYPQQWTEKLNAPIEEKVVAEAKADPAGEAGEEPAAKKSRPPLWMILPFAMLLLCVAFLPLHPKTAHWWENNMNKLMVGGTLGVLSLLYYLFLCDFPINQYWPGKSVVDPTEGGLNFAITKAVFINAIIYEFLPFIVLLFALFVITGGIRVASSLKGTPLVNTGILVLGTLLASFIGTTGAAVLLIRPLLDMNRHRKHKVHTIIFFIFCVCNCGGCLTPLGDPPLFLGYLRGVAFEWPLFALWPMWLFLNVILITMYYIWDRHWAYPSESRSFRDKKRDPNEKIVAISGWMLNLPLLLGVIAAIAFLDPGRPVPIIGETLFPENDGHPWFFLREAVQLGLAAISIFFSSLLIRKENVFNFLPIGEVAALFFGIFLTMQASLQILAVEGKDLVERANQATPDYVTQETLFFWTTGSLSLFLDNAPTYVVFFEAGKVLYPTTEDPLATERIHIKGVDKDTLMKAAQAGERIRVSARIGDTGEFVYKYVALTEAALAAAEIEDDVIVMARWKKVDDQGRMVFPNELTEGGEPMWRETDGQWRSTIDRGKLVPVRNGFIDHYLLIAVALGTVFMGGMTYIANAPNFLVKSIAEHDGVPMPSFFGFMVYSCLLLLPVIVIMMLIFIA